MLRLTNKHPAVRAALLAAALAACAGGALAQATPVGLWKTIDDATRKEMSFVRIVEAGGVLSGRIEKLLDPAKAEAVCEQCTDERRHQKVVGMAIIRGVRQGAEDKAVWDGGDILDPNNGKIYKVLLKPVQGGKLLEVRGYIGIPMFGRSQTWVRVE